MEKRPSKNSARSPALNQVEFSLRRDEDLQIGATRASTSARRRTTTAGIGMKIGELLPNGLGNRGNPIAGTNDAFLFISKLHDPESWLSRGGTAFR